MYSPNECKIIDKGENNDINTEIVKSHIRDELNSDTDFSGKIKVYILEKIELGNTTDYITCPAYDSHDRDCGYLHVPGLREVKN